MTHGPVSGAQAQAPSSTVTPDQWQELRAWTEARIALGRAGESLPTQPHLDLRLAHARARDAVHLPLAVNSITAGLQQRFADVLALHSAASDRWSYLRRPDLGRTLDEDSWQRLQSWPQRGHDLVIVVGDGLSARAVHEHLFTLLDALLPLLSDWRLGPAVLVQQARVAVMDPIGAALSADAALIILGERPGLSAADSLGLYLTWKPQPGRSDAERNCISNVRPGGQAPATAAHRLAYLLAAMRRLQQSGVALKDESRVLEDRVSPTLSLPLTHDLAGEV